MSDSFVHRREAVRTTFAAIEGIAWTFRLHIRQVADDLDQLAPLLDLALREKTYVVSDGGELIEQTRIVPLLAIVKLTCRTASTLNPNFQPSFFVRGWAKLKEATKIRNRLTHPKNSSHLSVSVAEMEATKQAFFWLLELATAGMDAANKALAQFNEAAHDLVDRLRQGDEETWTVYRRVLTED